MTQLDPFQANAIYTVEAMRRADLAAISAGTPGFELMERAGAAVADEAERLARTGARIAVLCGPGMNGGDGFVAARLLAERGYPIVVGLLGERAALRGDAGLAARQYPGAAVPLAALDFERSDLIIDALFGAGLDRPLAGDAKAAMERLNGCGAKVLSVDVPSGVSGDTGETLGAAVRATRTVTFHRLKFGHVLLPGAALCGEVKLFDIGLSAEESWLANVIGPAVVSQARRPRALADHKFSRGAMMVLSGGAYRTGAARLAAEAGLRVGAGIVTIASPRDAATENAAHTTAVMVEPYSDLSGFARLLGDERRRALLIGPGAGVGEATRGYVRAALKTDRTIVLDADALSSFAGQFDALADAIKSGPAKVAITPHEGEFHRLFGGNPIVEGAAGKVERARAAARALGAVVLYKGADTVVADSDGRVGVSWRGPATLATAGSSDALAGLICGLAAQGADPFAAATAGAWLHARCADVAGDGLCAEDLSRCLPKVLRNLSDVTQRK